MSGGGSDAHTGLKIGRALALARRERGLSLKEAEEATKIRAAYLRELERENFDVLPAVYVQGSLKTYANFLQLDGDALVRELKRQRAAVEEPRALAETQENDPIDRRTAVLGGAAGAKSPEELVEDREESGARALPASSYLALGFTVFVVLALVAAALVSSLAWEEEPAVSKVREPLIVKAPQASLVVEDEPSAPPSRQEDARGPDDEDDGPDDDGARSASPVARDGGDEGAAPPTGQALAAPPARDARGATARRPARTAPESAFAPRNAAGTAPAPVERSPSSSPAPGAPAPQGGAVQGTNAGGPGPITSAPRGGGFEVRIEVGGDDPVQITGHPTGAR